MPLRHFFIRDKYYGREEAHMTWTHNKRQLSTGKAFFCPICSELWAIAPVDGEETYVEHILCDKHEPTPSRPTPGCLYLPWDEDWNRSLSKEILARDFILMFNYKRNSRHD
jgi:hypothetical protein